MNLSRNSNPSTDKMQKPTSAFVGASWAALLIGIVSYLIGLWNANLQLNEKGFYFTILMFGLFAAVSLQKSVRDKLEGIPVTGIYFGLCWVSLGIPIVLLTVGLWNAEMENSEKGFYGISFLMSLFAAVTVQKNIRDLTLHPDDDLTPHSDDEVSVVIDYQDHESMTGDQELTVNGNIKNKTDHEN